MATIKSYTDISQSKTLSKILPLESADMYYEWSNKKVQFKDDKYNGMGISCWSLAALLGVLPSATLDSSDDHHYRVYCNGRFTDWYDNSIDACVAMILKLKESNLL